MRPGTRLGVDPGDARIGVAASDPSGFLASPTETVVAGKGALERLETLVAERAAVEVVVGLPRSLSGREGPAAGKVRAFAQALAARVAPVPVRLVDERLSTVTAEAVLRDLGKKGRKRRAVVDQAAAVVILQHALDTERATGRPPGEPVPETGPPTEMPPLKMPAERTAQVSDFGRMLGPESGTEAPDETQHDGLDGDQYYETFHRERRRSPRRGGRRGGGKALVVLVVIAALVIGAGVLGFGRLKDHFAPAPDYAGPGSGTVTFQVKQGDSIAAMGNALKRSGIVKSTDAFVNAARKNDKSDAIQVGYYSLKRQMKASEAVSVLVDPDNVLQTSVTIPEGARVSDVITTIAKRTKITAAQVTAVLKDPTQMGLPATADGNPEGYLFPATYTVTPGETAAQLLSQMVQKTEEVEQELGIAEKAKAVNLSVEQVFTVASILEYEANRTVDYPKVARVIYNRLNNGMPLQLDSTVTYLSKRKGDVWTTAAERSADSEYNTYKNAGLRPGPIGNPGEETLKAALAPAKGSWLYFLPDYADNTTLFFDDDGPARQAALVKLKKYCQTHDSC